MASIISAGTSSGTALNMTADTSGQLQLATNSGTTAVTINTSQNVGIGTTSPAVKLDISGDARIQSSSRLYFGPTTTGGWLDNNFGNDDLLNITAKPSGLRFLKYDISAETARIDSTGNFLVGCTGGPTGGTPGILIGSPANSGSLVGSNSTSSTFMFRFYNPNGYCGGISTSASATTYATSSDYRLKENIVPMTSALDKIAQLKPVTYTWKIDGTAGQGFIAHELQSVIPDCVIGEKDAVDKENNPIYQGVDTSFLVATLTAAIQELTERVKALESK